MTVRSKSGPEERTPQQSPGVELPFLSAQSQADKVGILLINLGSPDAPSFWPVRRYLKQFLSDRRVVETRGLFWWLILHGLVLTRRPWTLAQEYARIWDRTRGESPLKSITRQQALRLDARFGSAAVKVDWAMRYGTPSIATRIKRLVRTGCGRILLFPLYPQYSAATTASALDAARRALMSMRHQPEIRTVPPYYAHPAYIVALADGVRRHMKGLGWRPDAVVVSFHGLPKFMIDRGDPYLSQCRTTFQALCSTLDFSEEEITMAFQSNSGRGVWVTPFTEDTVRDRAQAGIANLLVITPGFAADCLETLEEIGLRAGQVSQDHGGCRFAVVPCLNDSAAAIDMLEEIARVELEGWCHFEDLHG